MKHYLYMTLIILLSTSLNFSCNADSETDGLSMLEYAENYCPWRTTCNNSSLLDCYQYYVTNDDSWTVEYHLNKGLFQKRLTCLKDVSNCEEYRSCVNFLQNTECDKDYEPHCEGDKIVSCNYDFETGTGQIAALDCSLVDQTCVERDSLNGHNVACGTADEVCSDDLEENCQGSLAFWCPGDYKEVPIVIDCAKYGYDCLDGGCIDQGNPSCEEHSCEGNLIHNCYNNRRITYDCHTVSEDFVCSPTRFRDGMSQMSCELYIDDWECGKAEASCEGNIAKVCVAGKLISVDCAKYENATCNEGSCEIDERE